MEPLLAEPWILDVDTTIKPLYGHQEGAVLGYKRFGWSVVEPPAARDRAQATPEGRRGVMGEAGEGEQPVADLLQAVGDGAAFQALRMKALAVQASR